MNAVKPNMLFDTYKLHAELADQASHSRERLTALYSGMVTAIIAASVLIHRFAPDSSTMWVLALLGPIVSISWIFSFASITGRLAAKNEVLRELEQKLQFDFLTIENERFSKSQIIRRRYSGQIMPVSFLVLSSIWLLATIF